MMNQAQSTTSPADAKIQEYIRAGYSRGVAVRMARKYFATISKIMGGK